MGGIQSGGQFWVLVGKKFSLGNVMICGENNKNYRQEFLGF